MVKTRREMLFLYDVVNANPNGDPADENKPRIDEESKKNIVTDVRLKRTVRDYLINYMGHNGTGVDGYDVFVRTTPSKSGKGIKECKTRNEDFGLDINNILKNCIDIRLFGGVLPWQKTKKIKGAFTLTGPVQFKMGQSLHTVEMKFLKGTGAFASKDGDAQQTFREEYILPYSLIAFYGVVNENAGKETKLTESDIEMLKKAMWQGTKNLISRSKMEHNPRMLLNITYKEANFFIGELDKFVDLISEKRDEQLRDPNDFILDFTRLSEKIKEYESKIEKIEIARDSRLQIKGIEFEYTSLNL